MTGSVSDINQNKPHSVYMALCLAPYRKEGHEGIETGYCHKRWLATVPDNCNLFKLQCPTCGEQNSFVSPVPEVE